MSDYMNDHARGCQGRGYICTCGYDDERDRRIEALETEAQCDKEYMANMRSSIEALQAELAKAREALTRATLERVSELIDWLDEHEENASLLLASLTQKQLEEARAALQQKEREA
jgi:hypothetical protein